MIRLNRLPKKIKNQIHYSYLGDKFVKRSKYGNRSCQCWDKTHAPHQSILESDICNQLNSMRRSGEIKYYTTQFKVPIVVNKKHIYNHFADFFVKFNAKKSELWEAKGYPTDSWQIKKKLVEALFPEIPYVVKYKKPKFGRLPGKKIRGLKNKE